MTREERVFEASKRFEESLTEKDLATLSKDDMCFAFQLGVKWAESHPESPWISVDDDLPCYHEELTHSNYTNRVLIAAKNGFVEVAFMSKIENVWVWDIPIKVTHWMPMPGLPKR